MKAGDLVAVPALLVRLTEEGALIQTRAPGGGRVVRMNVDYDVLVPLKDASDAAYVDVLEHGEAELRFDREAHEALLDQVETGPRASRLDQLEERVLRTEARTYAHRMALDELGANEALERAFLAEHGPARG